MTVSAIVATRPAWPSTWRQAMIWPRRWQPYRANTPASLSPNGESRSRSTASQAGCATTSRPPDQRSDMSHARSPQDLGRLLADAGCTAHEIMAALGHTTLAEAERYTAKPTAG